MLATNIVYVTTMIIPQPIRVDPPVYNPVATPDHWRPLFSSEYTEKHGSENPLTLYIERVISLAHIIL